MSSKDYPLLYKLTTNLVSQINGLPADELMKLKDECDKVTQSNCWWILYRLGSVVHDIVDNSLIDCE